MIVLSPSLVTCVSTSTVLEVEGVAVEEGEGEGGVSLLVAPDIAVFPIVSR